jgi:hypothetical protein
MKKSRLLRWYIVLAVLVLVGFIAIVSIDPIVEAALRKVLARTELSGYKVHFEELHTNLLDRRVRVTGLSVTPSEELLANDTAMRFHVEASKVELHGIELRELIFRDRLHVGCISLVQPTMRHSYASRERAKEEEKQEDASTSLNVKEGKQEKKKGLEGLSFVRIDTLSMQEASGTSTDRGGARADLSVQRLDLLALGLQAVQDENGKLQFRQQRTHLALGGLQLGMAPFYTLAIDAIQLDLPADTMRVLGIRLIPEVDPRKYHQLVDRQIEHYALSVDTALIRGFDVARNLSEGAIAASKVLLAGLDFNIHRDKSIPMGEFRHQPLPSAIIMGLPISISIDSIVGSRCKVTYNERTERGTPYGAISFTEIDGLLTGLDNTYNIEQPVLRLAGTAKLAGHGLVELDMRLPMTLEDPTVSLHAQLHNVPFDVVNRMTDKLVKVKATAGRIHRVDMRMDGNDISATGMVEVHYEDLHLELNSTKDPTKLLSLLANTVVRKTNMPTDRRYRKGPFQIRRNRDKGIFNFLWLGMREGMMEVMLPPVVMKRIKMPEPAGH